MGDNHGDRAEGRPAARIRQGIFFIDLRLIILHRGTGRQSPGRCACFVQFAHHIRKGVREAVWDEVSTRTGSPCPKQGRLESNRRKQNLNWVKRPHRGQQVLHRFWNGRQCAGRLHENDIGVCVPVPLPPCQAVEQLPGKRTPGALIPGSIRPVPQPLPRGNPRPGQPQLPAETHACVKSFLFLLLTDGIIYMFKQ